MLAKFRSTLTDPEGFTRTHFNFIGVAVEALTYEDLIDRIDHWISDKSTRSHHIACLNAYCLALAQSDKRLRGIYSRADLAGADGMPFVRFIRRFLARACDRFAAPDISLVLAEKAKEKGYTFYLYGGAPDVLKNMEAKLRSDFPHLQIVGSCSPPFRPMTEAEDAELCAEINRLKPDILLVGLGTPKQDYWIDDHLEKIRGSVLIASGATFDFFGGRIKMAPKWIRESGFEWLYRLFSKDFRRLFKRHTYYNLLFLSAFALQLLRLKAFPDERAFR